MEKQECDLFVNGKCKKYGNPVLCEQFGISEFDEEFTAIDMSEVCRKSSIYGNYYFLLTEKDIEALRAGKVLSSVDEYGTFIALER